MRRQGACCFALLTIQYHHTVHNNNNNDNNNKTSQTLIKSDHWIHSYMIFVYFVLCICVFAYFCICVVHICILWSRAKYLDHLAGQLTPLWSDSSLMVARPPSATVPDVQMQLLQKHKYKNTRNTQTCYLPRNQCKKM